MASSASNGSIFLRRKRTIGNASDSRFGSTSKSSSSTRTAASGITTVRSDPREFGRAPTSSSALRIAALTATRSTTFPGFKLGATAPGASTTRATADSADTAVSARAATTPCGEISHASRGRFPEGWGSKFMKLYLDYLARRFYCGALPLDVACRQSSVPIRYFVVLQTGCVSKGCTEITDDPFGMASFQP